MAPLQFVFADNAFKHGITEDEVIEVFSNTELPCLIFLYMTAHEEKIYNALGATAAGRYLTIGFVKMTAHTYRIIHVTEMKEAEKRRFKHLRKRK